MATVTLANSKFRIPFIRTIGMRLSMLVVLLILVTIVSMSIINYRTIRASILDEVHVSLELQNESMREILESAVDYQHGRIDALTNQVLLQQNLAAFVAGRASPAEVQANTSALLIQLRRMWEDVIAVQVLTPDGLIIASTDLEMLGNSWVDNELFIRGREEHFLSLLRLIDEPHVTHLSGPVISEDGILVGVVIADIESEFLRDSITVMQTGHATSSVRLGMLTEAGEQRYLFITNEHSISDLVEAGDPALQLAIDGDAGFLDGIFDHRDVEVVAAFRPVAIQDTNWGLVAQVDAREIYLPVREAFWAVIVTTVLFITIAVVFGILFVRKTLMPIHDLAEAAGRLETQDTALDVPTETNDEIGVLGRAFNAIIKERANYTASLQRQVKERTQELENSNAGLQRVVQRVESQNDLMERDLRRAEIFQKSLLPKAIPDMLGFSLAAMYLPGTAVGGDLYDVVQIDDDHVALLIADSAGHGASAAMLSVLFKLKLESPNASELLEPTSLFARVNRTFVEDLSAPGVFVTALLLIINIRTRDVQMVSAGHPPLLLVRANGDVKTLERTGPGLGLSLQAHYTAHRFNVVQGDQLLLYTDGLFDVNDEEPPTLDTLAAIIRSPDSHKPVLEQLFEIGSGHVNMEDRDDVTLCLLAARTNSNWVRTGSRRGSDVAQNPQHEQNGKSGVEYAETEQTTYLFLRGRVTWTFGESFFDAATSVLDENRPVVIEFERCDYLDSAMLGTLHQIVERATKSDLEVKLQHVSDDVKKTFVELGLGDVLNHIVDEAVWVPTNTLPLASSSRLERNTRVIQAHDALVQLNEHNREEFEAVVDNMREDFHAQSPPA